MATTKLSISLPPGVADLIHTLADAAQMSASAWVAKAVQAQAAAEAAAAEARAAADQLLAQAEAEHGPVTDAQQAWVAEVLASAGLTAQDTELTNRAAS